MRGGTGGNKGGQGAPVVIGGCAFDQQTVHHGDGGSNQENKYG